MVQPNGKVCFFKKTNMQPLYGLASVLPGHLSTRMRIYIDTKTCTLKFRAAFPIIDQTGNSPVTLQRHIAKQIVASPWGLQDYAGDSQKLVRKGANPGSILET